MAIGDGPYKHDWAAAYGHFWCRRCQHWGADAADDAGCPVAPPSGYVSPSRRTDIFSRPIRPGAFDHIGRWRKA